MSDTIKALTAVLAYPIEQLGTIHRDEPEPAVSRAP